jgi:hypothetical protein
MMPTMMLGMDGYTLLWVAIGVLLCLILMVTCMMLFVPRLKPRRMQLMQNASQPKDAYEASQQEYPAQDLEQPEMQSESLAQER